MGTRTNKCIGYGLTNVTGPNDRRFTKNIHDLKLESWRTWQRDFLRYSVKATMGMDGDHDSHAAIFGDDHPQLNELGSIADCVIYEEDAGLDNVVLFIPPFTPDWRRQGDQIDLIGIDVLNPELVSKPYVATLNHGLYPYLGTAMDMRTGQKFMRKHLEGFESEIEHLPDDAPCKIDDVPFRTYGEMRRYYRPAIPYDIVLMCRMLKVFRDDNTMRYLEPLLYIYWD